MIALETVRRQRDAHGARCQDCGAHFDISTSPFWHWSKSAAMHRSGTGHRVQMFRIVTEGRAA